MLKKFTYENNTLAYHEKIRKKILTTLNFLPQEFWNCNPIISGSYAIHLLLKPKSFYDDIDLYFESFDDYNNAKKILETIAEQKTSKNSNTFNILSKKIQLINKFFDKPENIIYAHDFKNSSICITKNEIFIDDEIFDIYYNGHLSIRSTQITNDMTEQQKIAKIGLLYSRILKYQERYDLSLDDPSLKILKGLQKYLQEAPKELINSITIDSNIYYNGTYSPYQNNLRSMSEILNHINVFLFPYDHFNESNSFNECATF